MRIICASSLVAAFVALAPAPARADGFVTPYIGFNFGGDSANCAGLTTCELALSNSATSAYGVRYAGGTPLPAQWNQYCDVHKFLETNLYKS